MSKEKNIDNDELFKAADRQWEQGNLREAKRLFLMAAENGDASSQLNLGVFFESGYGGAVDYERALHWYRKAARSGNSSACLNIGDLYRKRGNRTRELIWLRRAAQLGDGDAKLALAKALLEGGSRTARIRAMRLVEEAIRSENITQEGVEEARLILEEK